MIAIASVYLVNLELEIVKTFGKTLNQETLSCGVMLRNPQIALINKKVSSIQEESGHIRHVKEDVNYGDAART